VIDINIKKKLNNKLLDINIDITKNEFVVISGASGSGKTTLLRCLAGLEVSQGVIKVNNIIWQNEKEFLKIQDRNIGFVFQGDSLFTNMNVLENLLFVKEDKELANKLLEITEMSNYKNSMPSVLSGGQKQRVSICRALMNKPQILLLDEPFSALDSSIKSKLYNELKSIHKEFNLTTLLVSHDINEVYILGTRHIELKNLRIINDVNIDIEELISNTTNKNNQKLKVKILKIISHKSKKQAIVNINNSFVKISLIKNKNYKIGDVLYISINDLLTF
jgi:molybdate transport system ATP-binding protein